MSAPTHFLIVIFLRYFIIAGLAFLVFYRIWRTQWARRKIQKAFPAGRDYRREFGYSLLTVLIFWFFALSTQHPAIRPYTQVYMQISDYGWSYLVVSFFLMLIVHDTYFYWMHRLMHYPRWFRALHKVHHLSTNPSPWAALAFQPTEAIIEAAVIYPIVFLFPVHRVAILAWLLFMMAYNVYGHLGFELYPKGFQRHWLGRWMNTSVNHNQHHKHFTGNYGLYFLFWDRLMGTIREDYEAEFDRVKRLR